MKISRLVYIIIGSLWGSSFTLGEGFSKQQQINFFRDVSSRDLSGLAVRSDGRLVTGPALTPIHSDLDVDLAWDLERLDESSWLIATGPDGKILKLSYSESDEQSEISLWADLGSEQIFKLLVLDDGRVVAGTSPTGQVVLFSATGEKLASVNLPADSVFDFLEWDGGDAVLVGTGNPGRIMRIDLAAFVATEPPAMAPEDNSTSKISESNNVEERGVTAFGSIRDRNVRTLALSRQGHVLAGSAPSGNLYRFETSGGDPVILLNHEEAEITDIFVDSNGDVFVAVVHSATPEKTRVVIPTSGSATSPTPPAEPPVTIMEVASASTFSGRSSVIKLAHGDGLPDTIVSRSGIAIYRIAKHGELLIFPGGDSGELMGYDTAARRALTFAGSDSAQITDLSRLDDGDNFLLLTNNPVSLAKLDFSPLQKRHAETKSIDLRTLSDLGALRFNRLRGIDPTRLNLSLKTNRGSDETEGWTGWTPLSFSNGAWKASDLRGQYVKLRLEIPESETEQAQIDSGTLHHLPLNRRPSLQSFQVITPNFGLKLRADAMTFPPPTLAQISGEKTGARTQSDAERNKANLLASQVVPLPGAQLVTWTISDADGDNFIASFAVREEHSNTWIELASNTDQTWVQFDRSTLPDGIYFTKLVIAESAPRSEAQRHEITFETDDLVIDQTGPEITDVQIRKSEKETIIEVEGHDAMSMLMGIEVSLNNGRYLESEQTIDGILDEQSERFTLSIPSSDLEGATGFQIKLQDDAGNESARRIQFE